MTNSVPHPEVTLSKPASVRARAGCDARAREHGPFAAVRVVTLAELAREDRGFTRGHAHIGFDDYPHDAPGRLDFSPVKLAALQSIDPGRGYPMHAHANVETLLFVLDGTLVHEDTLGNQVRVGASELALLSAGSGMSHSEMVEGGGSGRAVLFWLTPGVFGTKPSFLTRSFPKIERTNRLVAVASGSPQRQPGTLPLLRDATLFAAHLESGAGIEHRLSPSRRAYVMATDAFVTVNCRDVEPGERVLAEGPGKLEIHAHGETELFLVDVD